MATQAWDEGTGLGKLRVPNANPLGDDGKECLPPPPATGYEPPRVRKAKEQQILDCQTALKRRLDFETKISQGKKQAATDMAKACPPGKPLGYMGCCMLMDEAGLVTGVTGICADFANKTVQEAQKQSRQERAEAARAAANSNASLNRAKQDAAGTAPPENKQSITDFFSNNFDLWVAVGVVGVAALWAVM